MMNYKEFGQAHEADFADGIGQMNALAQRLFEEGKLPERFTGLHSSLEGKVKLRPLTIGGTSKQELWKQTWQKVFDAGEHVPNMVRSSDFTILPKPSPIALGSLEVGDLAIGELPRFHEIEARRIALGLYLVPAEAALHYILQYGDQLKRGEGLYMGMTPITDPDYYDAPYIFRIERNDEGLRIENTLALPNMGLGSQSKIAFSVLV